MLPSLLTQTRRFLGFSPEVDTARPNEMNDQWLRLLLGSFVALCLLCALPLLLAGRWAPVAVVLGMAPLLGLLFFRIAWLQARRWRVRLVLFLALLLPVAAQWAFGGCVNGVLVITLSLLTPWLAAQAVAAVEERRFWQALHSAMMTLGALVEIALLHPDQALLISACYAVLLLLGWGVALATEQIHRQTVSALRQAQTLTDELAETRYNLGEADKVKNDFLASMSHEIRTPMHAISGMADMLLLSDQLGPTEYMQAENIKLASQNLLGLINDILDISKIEAGKLELYEERYDFPTMFHDVVSIISMRARDRGLAFLTQIDPDIPKEMIGDSGRIRQVLLNLLGNAVKFTEHGWVALAVQRQYHDNQMMLRFEVSDTGVGIHPQDVGRLFGVFEQLDSTRHQNRQGTGLGLAISRKLVELMHGQLDVSSELGHGTTFSFVIPQQIVSEVPIAEVPDARDKRLLVCSDQPEFYENAIEMASRLKVKAVRGLPTQAAGFTHMIVDLSAEAAYNWVRQPTPPGCQRALLIDPANALTAYIRMNDRVLFHPLHIIALAALFNDAPASRTAVPTQKNRECLFQTHGARVLLIDDNDVSLMVAGNLLALFGVQVDRANGGRQGIAMLENNAYDIVFIDHIMPEMDGVETVRAIRAMGGRFAQQVIIMLSANVMPESRKLFFSAGVNDMLAKPIELPKLSNLLSEYLDHDKQAPLQASQTQSGFLQARLAQIDQALRPLNLQRAQFLLSAGNIEPVDNYLLDLQTLEAQLTPYLATLRVACRRISRYPALAGLLQTVRNLLSRVGEARLSTRAKLLALALEQGDLGFARENLRYFVYELGLFLNALALALSECNLSGVRKPGEIMLLEQLHGQILAYQFSEANQTLLALHQVMVHITPDQFQNLMDALQAFDYRAAHEQVARLLELLTAQSDAAPTTTEASEVPYVQ